MALRKATTNLVAGAVVALIAAAVLLSLLVSRRAASRQVLSDGSVLVLNRVLVGSRIHLVHGTVLARLLGNLVPSNGVHLLHFNLKRRTIQDFDSFGKSWLVAEFTLSGPRAASSPLVRPAFFRQFRFVIHGEKGIDFAQELWGGSFNRYPEGYRGYIVTSRFPRDSRWLSFRVERRESSNHGGPWQLVAELKARNPVSATISPWVAEPAPIIRHAKGMDFVLRQIAVKPIPYMTNDIWNQFVNAPLEVRSKGVALTNWTAAYVHDEDASGNWDWALARWRSLDPRYVWKLDANFELDSGFPDGALATVRLPQQGATLTTNIMNVPVTVSWDGHWFDASIPTNNPDLALRFVEAEDDQGERGFNGAGSWSQYRFRYGDFMVARNGTILASGWSPSKATFAVVPNVHVRFYTQPKLLNARVKN